MSPSRRIVPDSTRACPPQESRPIQGELQIRLTAQAAPHGVIGLSARYVPLNPAAATYYRSSVPRGFPQAARLIAFQCDLNAMEQAPSRRTPLEAQVQELRKRSTARQDSTTRLHGRDAPGMPGHDRGHCGIENKGSFRCDCPAVRGRHRPFGLTRTLPVRYRESLRPMRSFRAVSDSHRCCGGTTRCGFLPD